MNKTGNKSKLENKYRIGNIYKKLLIKQSERKHTKILIVVVVHTLYAYFKLARMSYIFQRYRCNLMCSRDVENK